MLHCLTDWTNIFPVNLSTCSSENLLGTTTLPLVVPNVPESEDYPQHYVLCSTVPYGCWFSRGGITVG